MKKEPKDELDESKKRIWKKILETVNEKLQKKGRVRVFIRGEGPYCDGLDCYVFVTVRVDEKEFEYRTRSPSHVHSNRPYGADLYLYLMDNAIGSLESYDDFHSPGTHWWHLVFSRHSEEEVSLLV